MKPNYADSAVMLLLFYNVCMFAFKDKSWEMKGSNKMQENDLAKHIL